MSKPGSSPVISMLCVVALTLAAASSHAQETLTPDIENSKYQFAGVVNSNAVFVRSGPSENDYATMKLDKGAEVKVVGIRFEWLKVVPPEGSFCYVAKAFVDRRGDGGVGRVTNNLNVRVGSQLNELKAKIATKLEPGVDVDILGEEQEYFKIKPPKDVYFYINKQYVDPLRAIDLAAEGKPTPPEPQAAPAPQDQPMITQQPEAPVDSPQPDHTMDVAANPQQPPATPTTQPESAVAKTEAPSPAERSASGVSDAEVEFDRLEGEYAQASLKPLEEQPLDALLPAYQKLAVSDKLPESLRRIAEFKASVLQTRLEAKQQLAEAMHVQDDMKQKQMALRAEKEEIEQRLRETEIHFYTAVGTLRPSSLQKNDEMTMYRLTDPANGRTVVYLRTKDPKFGSLLGQFVGIKGEVVNDPNLSLRLITPTECTTVNPAKVGQSIAAQIVPPSLLPSAPAIANTNPDEK